MMEDDEIADLSPDLEIGVPGSSAEGLACVADAQTTHPVLMSTKRKQERS